MVKTKTARALRLQPFLKFSRLQVIISVAALTIVGLAVVLLTHASSNTTPVIRLYQPSTGNHFWTIDSGEVSAFQAGGWHLEGPAFYSCAAGSAGSVPVTRLYQSGTGNHFWTTDNNEVQAFQNGGWHLEGPAFYTCSQNRPDAVAVTRLYQSGTGNHFWTTSNSEVQAFQNGGGGWHLEGTAYFASSGAAIPTPVDSLSASPNPVNYNQGATLSWSATNNPTSCSGNFPGSSSASGTYNTPPLKSAATYTFSCSNDGGAGNAVSQTVNVNPQPSPSPRPTPSPSGGGGSSSSGGSSPSPTVSVAPQPLLTPSNFSAQLDAAGAVAILAWSPSTGGSGVITYHIDRSTDQTTWTSIADSLTYTSYTDKNTTFGVHYYYRLRANDASGAATGYATTDIATGSFSANVGSDGSMALASSDNLVHLNLPSGSVSSDTSCSLVADPSNQDVLKVAKLQLIAGPYTIVCKDSSGNLVANFNSPVTLSISLKDKRLSKYTGFKLYQYDTSSSAWKLLAVTTKNSVMTATTSQPIQIAVLGTVKHGLSWSWIFAILFILAIGGGIFFFRLRQQQKAQYNDYIRKKYYNL